MKKYFLMLCVALMPMIALTSCSDDDDDDKPGTNLAEKVKGTHTLSAKVTVEGQPEQTVNGISLAIASVDESYVKVSFDAADIDINGVIYDFKAFDVTLGGTEEEIKIDQKDIEIDVERKDDPGNFEGKVSLSGTIANGTEFNLTMAGTLGEDVVSIVLTSDAVEPDPDLAGKIKGEHTLSAEVSLAGNETKYPLSDLKLTIAPVEESKTKVTFDLAEVNFTGAIYDFKPFEITLGGEENAITIDQKDVEFKVERKDEGNQATYDAKLSFVGTVTDGTAFALTVTGLIDDDQVTIVIPKPADPE